jgi:hypothetical protein
VEGAWGKVNKNPRTGNPKTEGKTCLGCDGSQKSFMWLEGPAIGKGRRSNVKREGLGVFVGYIECVLEVHLECITAPMQAIFNEGRGELCSMEEVSGGNPNGVGAPLRDGRILHGKVINRDRNGLKPFGVFGACDLGIAPRFGRTHNYGNGMERRDVQLQATFEDAKDGLYRTGGR